MKLIVAGSTGFVATEVLRQALSIPAITSVAALGRRKTAVPPNLGPKADVSKLKSVVCEDFGKYDEKVTKELEGADACIWLLAVTPTKSKTMAFADVRRICVDYTVTGLETMSKLSRSSAEKPFRFIYTSGAKAERDQTKKPWILGDYCLMRGEVENHVLDFAAASSGTVEACITKPGIIDAPGKMSLPIQGFMTIARATIALPIVQASEIAATLLEQALNGIEKDTLLNEDLERIGRRVLAARKLDQ